MLHRMRWKIKWRCDNVFNRNDTIFTLSSYIRTSISLLLDKRDNNQGHLCKACGEDIPMHLYKLLRRKIKWRCDNVFDRNDTSFHTVKLYSNLDISTSRQARQLPRTSLQCLWRGYSDAFVTIVETKNKETLWQRFLQKWYPCNETRCNPSPQKKIVQENLNFSVNGPYHTSHLEYQYCTR